MLPLVAILSTVLIGFVGLVIDSGSVSQSQQQAQAAADAAALAAFSNLSSGGTLSSATGFAGTLAVANGIPISALTVTFLDASGAVTASPTAVAEVAARVAISRPTYFLPALGIDSVPVSALAHAGAVGTGPAPAPCALCLFSGSGTDLSLLVSASLSTGSPIISDSTSARGIGLASRASITASAVGIAGGGYSLGSGSTITPTPVVQAAVADPWPSLAAPQISGTAVNYTSPSSGSGSINPGLYSQISVVGTFSLNLTPGLYVLTGSLSTTAGAALSGTGVSVYLACPGYPTACPSGAAGGGIAAGGSTFRLSAPSTGSLAGMAIFADRGNAQGSVISAGTTAIGGTWYAIGSSLQIGTGTPIQFDANLLLASLHLNRGAQLALNPSGAGQYQGPSASAGGVALLP